MSQWTSPARPGQESAPRKSPGAGQVLLLGLTLPLVLISFEILVEKRAAMPAWGWAEWKVFLTGILWSLAFWFSLVLWGAWWTWKGGHKRRVAWGLGGLFTAWILLTYFTSYKYLADMYHLPNVHILQFTLLEPGNAWALAKEVLHPWHLGAALLVVAALAWIMGNRFLVLGLWLKSLGAFPRRLLLGGLSIGFVSLSILTLGWHRYQDPLPWDANWHRIFFQYGLMIGGNSTNLRTASRGTWKPPRTPAEAPRHNVLVILNESLRADAVLPQVRLFEGFSDTLAPRMARRLASDSLYRVFPRAYANAGATNASVPSLATGLPPEASTYDFHRHPTFWNIAKSLGYRTFLFSPQDWRWEHFDEFFLDRDVDHSVHRCHFAAHPLVNDLGIDDGLVVDSLLAFLESSPRDRPFFGVIQFNITHPPFYGGPATAPMPILTRERYRPTMELLDVYQDRLLEGLEKLGLFDNTLIIYTADHGENIRSRNLGRLGSFHDESLRVPIWIKPPRDSAWLASRESGVRNLSAWTTHPVQNLDIVPTLLDFWNQPPVTPWGGYAGRSLLGPGADSPRTLGAQNTGEIRAWSPEGCFVMRQPYKLVLSNHTPPQLFDIERDPFEQVNLWEREDVRRAQIPWIASHLRALQGRLDLCRRLR
ncbi:MAG TPA: sulfatase-like hydrolase/transferase, partial [Fibrobacteria bacterium]|nr:sulfatase-like hydrolase/transferase [Fibrobacteria bacterium]